jgi:hypothetical protein
MELLTVCQRLTLMLKNQFNELKHQEAQARITRAHRHNLDIFADMHYHVSAYALDKMLGQYRLALKMDRPENEKCSMQFTTVYGLPCSHAIKSALDRKQKLDIMLVHRQWRIDLTPLDLLSDTALTQDLSPVDRLMFDLGNFLRSDDPNSQAVFVRVQNILDSRYARLHEPDVLIKTRGRHAGARTQSTGRIKSAFEYAEGPKCSICRKEGHNRQTCKKRARPNDE